jgi:integrase
MADIHWRKGQGPHQALEQKVHLLQSSDDRAGRMLRRSDRANVRVSLNSDALARLPKSSSTKCDGWHPAGDRNPKRKTTSPERIVSGFDMSLVALPYVQLERDRHGAHKYRYFRYRDRRWRLPGEPGSEECMTAYYALLALVQKNDDRPGGGPLERTKFCSGSFGALIQDYLKSTLYTEKAASTRALYRRILDKLCLEHGHKSLKLLKRRHIRKMRDALSETPGAANNVLRLLKIVLYFAVDQEVLLVNPAARIKELKGGEFRSWTDEECKRFEEHWAPGTMQRRAYAIALYTGQRRSDQVLMTNAHRSEETIQVRQEKTNEWVSIPEHPELSAELARGNQVPISLLTTSRGKAFDPVYYGAWFADAIDSAGLPNDCVLHGLRKCAARRLAEAGCSESEIMAITGHRTSRMVSHYIKDVSKQRQAYAAITKLKAKLK